MNSRFIAISILALALTACSAPGGGGGAADSASGTPKSGGTVTVAMRSDPTGWDPWGNQRGNDPVRMAVEMVFSPLLVPAANVGGGCEITWEGELAEAWKVVDDKTVDFTIRPGVKWQNKPPLSGRTLTAEDVVYTLEERVKPGSAGSAFPVAAAYESAEVVGGDTVRVHLKQPFNFVDTFFIGGGGWVVAPEAAGPDGREWLEKPELSWIGTGPFLFQEYQSGVKVAFTRNPDYFKPGRPYVDKIELLVMPDEATKMAALRSGVLDIYPKAGPQSMEDIKKTNPAMGIRSCLSNFQAQLKFRLEKPPFNDVRVRQAVSMALNRDVIVKNAIGGNGAPVYQLWPEDPEALKLADYPSDVRRYMEYRPDDARKLLAEAGYPQGFKTSMVWTQYYGSPWNEIAETMVTMLKDAGIDTELKLMDYAAFLRLASSGSGTGEFEGMALAYSNLYSLDQAGADYSSRFTARSDSFNIKKMGGDPKLDAMIEQAWQTLDKEKHKALARDIQIYLAQQVYSVRSPTWGNGIISQPYIKNLGWRGSDKIYTNLFDQMWVER